MVLLQPFAPEGMTVAEPPPSSLSLSLAPEGVSPILSRRSRVSVSSQVRTAFRIPHSGVSVVGVVMPPTVVHISTVWGHRRRSGRETRSGVSGYCVRCLSRSAMCVASTLSMMSGDSFAALVRMVMARRSLVLAVLLRASGSSVSL